MLTTDDKAIWEKAWSFKDHGKSWRAVHRPDESDTFRWVHESCGTNWRMTEMQAALGRVAVRRLPDWIKTRREHAATLDRHLGRLPALRTTLPPEHIAHSYYKYYAFIRPERLRRGWSRDEVVGAIRAEGIPARSGSCPEIYKEKAFDRPGLRPAERLPIARQLGQTSLMLLVHPTLSEEDMLDTCRAMEKVLAAASSAEAA